MGAPRVENDDNKAVVALPGEAAERTDDIGVGVLTEDVDERYLAAGRWTKFYRGVLFQMILLGALSFVGPAISDAIGNLGGGGFSQPYLANLATSLNYVGCCIMALFGGPLINKFGIRWSCMVSAVVMPLYGSAYYAQARYGTAWYLLLASLVTGFGGGFVYVGESTAMLSYPTTEDRGFYLGVWAAMRTSGSVVGGAINFSVNNSNSHAGAVSWATYLIFVGFECTGVIWAFLLSPSRRVRRVNGSRVPESGAGTWKQEFKALWLHMQTKKMWLVFIPAFYSFYFGGTMSTYLTNHFSVRARALSSLLTRKYRPSTLALKRDRVLTNPRFSLRRNARGGFFGFLLDSKRLSQKGRAWAGFIVWVIVQAGGLLWLGIEYGKFGTRKVALDYAEKSGSWALAYIPFLIIYSTPYLTQLSIYYTLGCFSTDIMANSRTGGLFRAFETMGQATSFALNASTSVDVRTPFYVECALLLLSIPPMIMLIRMIPQTAADTDTVVAPLPEPAVAVAEAVHGHHKPEHLL